MIVSDLRSAETLHADIAEVGRLPVELVLGNHPLTLLDDIDVLAISGGVPGRCAARRCGADRGISVTNDSANFCCVAWPDCRQSPEQQASRRRRHWSVRWGTAASRPTWVGGNIGRPLLADLDAIRRNDLVVRGIVELPA